MFDADGTSHPPPELRILNGGGRLPPEPLDGARFGFIQDVPVPGDLDGQPWAGIIEQDKVDARGRQHTAQCSQQGADDFIAHFLW